MGSFRVLWSVAPFQPIIADHDRSAPSSKRPVPGGTAFGSLWVIFDRSSPFCLPVDFRLAPKADNRFWRLGQDYERAGWRP